MSGLALIVGYLVTGAIACAVIALSVIGVVHAFLRLLSIRYEEARQSAIIHAADRLYSDSWWFSEDPPTMKLLQRISATLITHGWCEVSALREEWQKWRTEL